MTGLLVLLLLCFGLLLDFSDELVVKVDQVLTVVERLVATPQHVTIDVFFDAHVLGKSLCTLLDSGKALLTFRFQCDVQRRVLHWRYVLFLRWHLHKTVFRIVGIMVFEVSILRNYPVAAEWLLL